MRTLVGGLVLLAVTAAGCGGSADTAADATADSAAMMAVAEPAGLSPADLAGTWNGVNFAEASDSVTQRWTIVAGEGTDGRFVAEGSTDTVSYTVAYSADSVVATSAPYTDPTMPAGSPQITFRSVGRMVDGKLVGTSALMLATAPDSVLGRGRWEATRAP
jgi:hypothetical protein